MTEQILKRVTHKVAFARILAELTKQPSIRFAFDHYIRTPPRRSPSPFQTPLSLEQSCSLAPLAGALLLPLHDRETPLDFFPLPQKAGSGLFLSPACVIPWPQLFSTAELSFLLIGFAQQRTFFRAGSSDPLASELKKFGYAFNDLLKEPLHPLLYTEKY